MRYLALSTFLLFSLAPSWLQAQSSAPAPWGRVETANFVVVGNIDHQRLQFAAQRLERFRNGVRGILGITQNDAFKTRVIIFRDAAEFRAFKPKRSNGRPDDLVAGSFQAGNDVNYIASSDDGKDLGSIFHEYVHDLISRHFDRDEIPSWLNEGLAEYFQQFRIIDDRRIEFGLLDLTHLSQARGQELLPWEEFSSIDDVALQQSSDEKRLRFYSQALITVHVMTRRQVNAAGTSGRIDIKKLLRDALALLPRTILTEIKSFAAHADPQLNIFRIEIGSTNIETHLKALSDADTNSYLGDLAYRNRDFSTAETYFAKAISVSPAHAIANAGLGVLRTSQRRFSEAKVNLEKAIANDSGNFLVYFYMAYLISREHTDQFGSVRHIPPESAQRMRSLLQQSAALNPGYAESHKLLAVVSLIDGEKLEDALSAIKKAVALQPSNQEYRLIAAQLFLRLERPNEAAAFASQIIAATRNKYFRSEAEDVMNAAEDMKAVIAEGRSLSVSLNENIASRPLFLRRKDLTDADVERIELTRDINNLNRLIERPKNSERQDVGRIELIVCSENGSLSYRFRGEAGLLTLSGKNFDDLRVKVLLNGTHSFVFRCGITLEKVKAVVIYRPENSLRGNGSIVSVAFVPDYFKLKTVEELSRERQVIIEGLKPSELVGNAEAAEADQREFDRQIHETQLRNIEMRLRELQPTEKRVLAVPSKFACENGRYVLNALSEGGSSEFSVAASTKFDIRSFTPDTGLLEVACGVPLPAVPAVITYREISGINELIALEFVPKIFKLK